MKIYEDYSPSPDEWDKSSVLELGDDGRFSYHETLTSYGGSIWGKAEGIWWRSDEGMFFRPEQVAGFMYMSWKEGHAWKVIAHEDRLEFPGSFTLYLRPEKPVLPNDGL